MTQPQKPIGQPLPLTPEELDQVAEVTPFDVAQARALWQQNASAKLTDLLDAEPRAGGSTDATQ